MKETYIVCLGDCRPRIAEHSCDEDGLCTTCGGTLAEVVGLDGAEAIENVCERYEMLERRLSSYQALLGLKDEPRAVVVGEKMPRAIALVCNVLAEMLDLAEDAKNYLYWGWTNEATNKSYRVRVSYAEGKSPETLADEATEKLRELLAVIHRDGGHYEEEHGMEKAWQDAMTLSSERIHARDDALEEAAKVCEGLGERFGSLAKAFGVGKSDHAEGGDLCGIKAITAEECAALIRQKKGETDG